MSDLSRRRLLALTGAATTAAIAGCSSDEPEDEDPESEDNQTEGVDQSDAEPDEKSETDVAGTVLGDITIENLHGEPHTVDVLVEFDGEFAWETIELDGRTGAQLDRNWPSEPGSFRVIARLDQGDPVVVTPAKWNNPSCINLVTMIRESGLSMAVGTDDGPCGSDDESTGADGDS
ncbi:hypothetical protein [Halosolutus gelatinilyticus]|uniref:hypothetical protein n=1 Tax=Halosolutus gelatinilyticus TaxID=2931975 RepID=UPI001FF3EDDE|nr:hypothetical protein [Halosolutus gelatinilyticus]